MARKLYINETLTRDEIEEEIRLIKGSKTDYVTKSGRIYKMIRKGRFIEKKTFIIESTGYLYCNITLKDGKNHSRRVHRLVAQAFLPNPNNLPIVGHKDNDKTNPNVENLKWTTISENTKKAYDEGLAHNDKGYADSQSIHVYAKKVEGKKLLDFGSIREASRELGINNTTIARQCEKHKKGIPFKSRCGYLFWFQDDYDDKK